MNFKKLLCLVLCVCLVSGALSSWGLNASAQSQSDYEQAIDEIDSQIASYEQKLAELAADAEKQNEYLETLEAQIDAVESKANELQNQISEINNEIDELKIQYNQLKLEIDQKNKSIKKATLLIAQNEQHIENNKELLSAKLRSAYMNGNESTLKILMGADSLASFLTRLEMMKRTSESDKKTIDSFKEKVTYLRKARVQLEEDKKIIVVKQQEVVETAKEYNEKKLALQANQAKYKSTLAEIETKYAGIETYIASLDKNSAVYQNYIADLQQQKADANAALDEYISNYYASQTTLPVDNDSDGSYDDNSSSGGGAYYESSDTWAWPVGGASYYISAYYLDPSYLAEIGSNHYGIDISGGGFYGTNIYAARAGTVVTSGDAGDGYGNKVIIDHGDGFMTVYAHNSLNEVSTGEYVTKGQLIAYAGSTGYSTGPHLHYEVRFNGEKVNPANYHPGYV